MSATINIGLRISSTLRDKLATTATLNGRSLNSEIVQRLTEMVTRRNDPVVSTLIDTLDLPKVVRVRSRNTSDDLSRIAELCERLAVDDLLLAATPNDLNYACLVAVVQTPSIAFVIDSTWLNMARQARIGEIEHLFQRLDVLGLLDGARFCTRLVPTTDQLEPKEAVATIVREGQPAPLDLQAYLRLLSGHGLFELERFRASRQAHAAD